MSEIFAFLALPALACAALVGIHAYFGLHVLSRNVIFVDLALAQVAALGATAAFLLGHPPQGLAAHGYALAFTLAAAALLATTRRWSERIPQEAQIGVIYVVAAAAALLLVDRAPQGAEHIRQILTGNILTVGWDELRWAIPLYALVGLLHPALGRWIAGRYGSGWLAEFAFYAAFGLVVTSSVGLAGVLLVFAFLIIPAAIGVLHAQRFRGQLVVAWIAGTVVALAGLAISYAWDLSTGATLVCAFGVALVIAGIARRLRTSPDLKALLLATFRGARVLTSCALAASAAWIVIAPRADQPVLDALEHAVPALRSAYMSGKDLAIANDAGQYAERYRGDAARLRAMEAERRWKGEPLDEHQVRRTASFLKSYNEMIQGEVFVIREVRSRAREANRLAIGAAFLLLALAIAPWSWRRRPNATASRVSGSDPGRLPDA
jgi:zinc/manganese transport system permease protein